MLKKTIGNFKVFDSGSKPEPEWIFRESERAFGGAHKSYRVKGRPKMDVEMFFNRTRQPLIELIDQELKTHNSAKIQMTTWIRFAKDDDGIDLAFNSKMTRVYRGSDFDKIVNEMFSHMETQIESPALLNSRFVSDEVL